MQFNSTINIISNRYNDFGEEVAQSSTAMKCCVLASNKRANDKDNNKTNTYDLKIIVGYKGFAPYSKIFDDDTALFVYNATRYRPILIAGINDFSGKTKYFEIEMRQVK